MKVMNDSDIDDETIGFVSKSKKIQHSCCRSKRPYIFACGVCMILYTYTSMSNGEVDSIDTFMSSRFESTIDLPTKKFKFSFFVTLAILRLINFFRSGHF